MTLYGYFSILLTALAVGVPIYFVIFRRRFWFAALVSWILLVASQQVAVLDSPSIDTTTVGLTLFSGWLVSIPFCGFLLLIRLFLNRIGLLPARSSGREFVANGHEEQGEQVAQPAQPAQEFHVGDIRPSVGTSANSGPTDHRETVAPDRWTIPDPCRITMSDNKKPTMIEVPPARIPEEPGSVIPHAGICEGGVGQPTSLP